MLNPDLVAFCCVGASIPIVWQGAEYFRISTNIQGSDYSLPVNIGRDLFEIAAPILLKLVLADILSHTNNPIFVGAFFGFDIAASLHGGVGVFRSILGIEKEVAA